MIKIDFNEKPEFKITWKKKVLSLICKFKKYNNLFEGLLCPIMGGGFKLKITIYNYALKNYFTVYHTIPPCSGGASLYDEANKIINQYLIEEEKALKDKQTVI